MYRARMYLKPEILVNYWPVLRFSIPNSRSVIWIRRPNYIELTINKGRGYVPAEENRARTFWWRANYSHWLNLRPSKTQIWNWERVEQKTDYEKLIIEVTPTVPSTQDALKKLPKYLSSILHSSLTGQDDGWDHRHWKHRGVRRRCCTCANCWSASYPTWIFRYGHSTAWRQQKWNPWVVMHNKNDLLKFRNFGKKSLTELEELLDNLSLSFDMDISKYKLDKD